MKKIAVIHNGFKEKFGIPRQSGLAPAVISKIVFEKEYRIKEAVRDIEGYSHLWLIWDFSKAHREEWSPTVRPPRLGGNRRTGVFATRSPFRPNPLGLSVVRLERVDLDSPLGPVLYVSGADLMDQTPIFDIKPYLPYADSIADAEGGFTDTAKKRTVSVSIPEDIAKTIGSDILAAVTDILAEDPRPAYQDDPRRIYKMIFDCYEFSFSVEDSTLSVLEVKKI
ncbi:MAG: tRNA (N6-threonylcarbamoyladenosine(37)-N6)-methyltransferase TrmO [Clostridia bacterium]|nr:tRNA (N6-threonylcarbamoyladenosine(37)-N6)-methyltransferase TrmO [Clostridia bacterium]